MFIYFLILPLMTLFLSFGLTKPSRFSLHENLKTVPYVDLLRYSGNWYQIAGNPLPFDQNCVCTRQNLAPLSDGRVSVYNTCNFLKSDGRLLEIRGVATNLDPQSNAKLEVDFGLPDKGQYWIIALDNDYRYAVVSEPSKQALFILSKEPTLSPELYELAVRTAALQVDVSKLKIVSQSSCSYP